LAGMKRHNTRAVLPHGHLRSSLYGTEETKCVQSPVPGFGEKY
jgi:hypothetical protein